MLGRGIGQKGKGGFGFGKGRGDTLGGCAKEGRGAGLGQWYVSEGSYIMHEGI